LYKLVRSARVDSIFVGLGGWVVRGSKRKICQEKLRTKKTIKTSGKLCFVRLCLYILYKLVRSARVNSILVGLGGWVVRGNERKICQEGGG